MKRTKRFQNVPQKHSFCFLGGLCICTLASQNVSAYQGYGVVSSAGKIESAVEIHKFDGSTMFQPHKFYRTHSVKRSKHLNQIMKFIRCSFSLIRI